MKPDRTKILNNSSFIVKGGFGALKHFKVLVMLSRSIDITSDFVGI